MEWKWLILWVFWCYGCAVLYWSLREYLREHKKQRDEDDRLEAEIITEDRGFSPRECRKYHLPGDCPLCGAD